jgi:putative membrane protein
MIKRATTAAALTCAMILTTGGAFAQGSSNNQAGTSAQPARTSQADGQASARDKTFLKNAIEGDMAEVQLGQLAQQRAADQDVKQFGQTLATDHGQNLEKAKPLAQSIGMTPPDSINAEQKAIYDRLSKLSGKTFDQQFAHHMVQDHKKDISKFENESKKGGPVANFAEQTLPTLKKHLEIAQSLSAAGATTGSSRR